MTGTIAGLGGSELAYRQIRRAIVEGRYAPGSRLVEQALSASLSVSRTPVREALRRLEMEGLVVFRRHRGAVVWEASADDLFDHYELRVRMESYAAELAAERGGEEERAAIFTAADDFEAAVIDRPSAGTPGSSSVWAIHDANGRFHGAVVAAAHHERLGQLLVRTVDLPLVFRAFRRFDRLELRRSAYFHGLIAGAIGAGQGVRAGRLMAEHILYGRDRVLAGSEEGEDSDAAEEAEAGGDTGGSGGPC